MRRFSAIQRNKTKRDVPPFPLLPQSVALDDDLKIALDIVVARGSKIAGDRKARMKRLRSIAATLEPMRHTIDSYKCTESKEISAQFNVAWAAAVVDALDWPDVELPARYIDGFDVVFDVSDSRVFIASEGQLSDEP